MDEKKLEVMKMVVDGEKLEENENIKISEGLVQLTGKSFISRILGYFFFVNFFRALKLFKVYSVKKDFKLFYL